MGMDGDGWVEGGRHVVGGAVGVQREAVYRMMGLSGMY